MDQTERTEARRASLQFYRSNRSDGNPDGWWRVAEIHNQTNSGERDNYLHDYGATSYGSSRYQYQPIPKAGDEGRYDQPFTFSAPLEVDVSSQMHELHSQEEKATLYRRRALVLAFLCLVGGLLLVIASFSLAHRQPSDPSDELLGKSHGMTPTPSATPTVATEAPWSQYIPEPYRPTLPQPTQLPAPTVATEAPWSQYIPEPYRPTLPFMPTLAPAPVQETHAPWSQYIPKKWRPTFHPTSFPSYTPTSAAPSTGVPSQSPTKNPTTIPTKEPTFEPSKIPSMKPTEEPSKKPTKEPKGTHAPTDPDPSSGDDGSSTERLRRAI